jgi:hypothetical protein
MAEMGEYLVGAYLRLIIGCEIVTYNQRLSRERGQFGEADVLGIDVDGTTIYVCEVVTHLGGLLYSGGNEKSLRKLSEKFERIAAYSVEGFPTHKHVLMLWSPYVPKGILTTGLAGLRERLREQGHPLELRINEEYTAAVDELRNLARRDTKDHGEPFFRALQILEHLRHRARETGRMEIHPPAALRSARSGGTQMSHGRELIDQLANHVLATMRRMPECAPGGEGGRNADIQNLADLNLELPKNNGWLTYSLLHRLALDGKIEILGPRGQSRYRFAR